METDESSKGDEGTFEASVVNKGYELVINRPVTSRVVVNFYQIDLELYFSEFPFTEASAFSAVVPSKSVELNDKTTSIHVLSKTDYKYLGDTVV